jgi:hypothetical protein
VATGRLSSAEKTAEKASYGQQQRRLSAAARREAELDKAILKEALRGNY